MPDVLIEGLADAITAYVLEFGAASLRGEVAALVATYALELADTLDCDDAGALDLGELLVLQFLVMVVVECEDAAVE